MKPDNQIYKLIKMLKNIKCYIRTKVHFLRQK